MTYIQGKNPISRKTSPLNASNPFKRVSPLNEVMLDPSDDAPISPQNAEMLAQMDTTQGEITPQDDIVSPLDHKNKKEHKKMRKDGTIKEHRAKMHGIDPAKEEQREEDMTQGANTDMGPERRSSQSPLNAHGEKVKQIEAKIEELRKKYGEADFYERKDVQALFKQKTEAEESHKEETPKEEE